MALNGSVRTSAYTSQDGERQFWVTLEWSATQSTEDNTSTVTFSLIGHCSVSDRGATSGPFHVYIDGKNVMTLYTGNRIEITDGDVIGKGSVTIAHDADGTGSFNARVEAAIYYSDVNVSGEETFTLDRILRASQPTVSDETAYLGQPLTIYTNQLVSSYSHGLYYTLDGGKSWVTIAAAGTVVDSFQWTPPLELARQIPNDTQMGFRIMCRTFDGKTEIGDRWVHFTLAIPETMLPGVTLTHRLIDSTGSGWGEWMQGYCEAGLLIDAQGAYGSTITEINGLSGAENGVEQITEPLVDAREYTWSVTVTDSRGRTATASTSVHVLPVEGDLYIPYRDTGRGWEPLKPVLDNGEAFDLVLPLLDPGA